MGGLAAIAREAGFTVTGCDAGVYPPMSDQLAALGIELVEGFEVAQLETLSSPPRPVCRWQRCISGPAIRRFTQISIDGTYS